jgi:hypothetical protein
MGDKYQAYITINPVWENEVEILDDLLKKKGFTQVINKENKFSRIYTREGNLPNKLSRECIEVLGILKEKKYNILEWEIKSNPQYASAWSRVFRFIK